MKCWFLSRECVTFWAIAEDPLAIPEVQKNWTSSQNLFRKSSACVLFKYKKTHFSKIRSIRRQFPSQTCTLPPKKIVDLILLECDCAKFICICNIMQVAFKKYAKQALLEALNVSLSWKQEVKDISTLLEFFYWI